MSNKTDGLKTIGILMMMKIAYKYILRDMLKRAIDDPDESWDDTVLEIVDRLFNYKEQ